MTTRQGDLIADDDLLRRQVRGAEQSRLPVAITRGRTHAIHHVNGAFARFLHATPQELEGVGFESLTSDRTATAGLFERALRTGLTESAAELAYRSQRGEIFFGATLVQRVERSKGRAAVVHVVESTSSMRGRGAEPPSQTLLMQANEQLVLGNLREQEVGEVAAKATLELQRLLGRQCLLAGASARLSASLDLGATLRAVVRLALPELAECCLARLVATDTQLPMTIAHVDISIEQQLVELRGELAHDADLAVLEEETVGNDAPHSLMGLSNHEGRSAPFERATRHVLRNIGAQSCLALPLSARGQVIGVMFLVAFSDHRFEPRDVLFAQELARRAGTALDNARLFHEARQASRMREDVLAIVSHDLRNPLGAIAMTVQHLLRQDLARDAKQTHQALQLIHRSSIHMEGLIEELLQVAKLQTGDLPLQYSRVSLDGLVGRAVEMFERAGAQKGMRIIRRAVLGDASCACDAEKVVRVIANLLNNAIKFTPRGGSVEVAGFALVDEVRIRVSDTGPGIAKEEQPKLFEQYWKGEQTGRVGMGLGLYIARGIVQAHRGRIWVESAPPHGSSFTFALPRERKVRLLA